jgi:rhodanese-related sulfurtransferase
MIRFRITFVIPVFALVFAACAKPPAPTAISPVPTVSEKAPYKKPIRMNGRGKVSSISLEQFFVLRESGKALVFDARPAFFYSLGHIPGAVHLPKSNCDERIHEKEGEIKAALAAGKTIIVYCTSVTCPDARTVAMHISGFGYPATVFSGGWDAWKEAEMPAE